MKHRKHKLEGSRYSGAMTGCAWIFPLTNPAIPIRFIPAVVFAGNVPANVQADYSFLM
ncbi:MAG: hypothetical protein FWH27_13190 [Planctomycetaceae bacterium]|nr:hypothetical protein [Planctomycetaceae bacterium]